MKTFRFLMGCVLAVCLLAGWGHASAAGPDFERASSEAKAVIPANDPDKPAILPQEAAHRLSERYVSHLAWQFDFAQRSWSWHFYSTILLFFIVLLIVGFGLRITYLQFQRDYGPRPVEGGSASGPAPPPPAGAATSTMKLSTAGLELSSQIIGLFVLGFSLAFFYLYVKEVYPIQVLNLNQSNPQAATAKTTSGGACPAAPAK